MTQKEKESPSILREDQRRDNASGWAAFCAFSALGGVVFPLGHLLFPLIVWGMKRNTDTFLNETGKMVLNFQFNCTLLFLITLLFMLSPLVFIVIFLFIGGVFFWGIMTIVGGLKAMNGEVFSYPLIVWRILK